MRKQVNTWCILFNVSDILTKKVLDFCVELLYNYRYFLKKEKTKWQAKI